MSKIFILSMVCCFAVSCSTKFPGGESLPFQPQLPDPFTSFSGKAIRTPSEWDKIRRPELKELFQKYVYGELPPPTKIAAKVTRHQKDFLPGLGELKEVEISFPELAKSAPKIHLALFLPKKAGKVPVFLALNKCGNDNVIEKGEVASPPEAWRHPACSEGKFTREIRARFWEVENTLRRGYAFATFHESEVDPDRNDFTDGIHPFFPQLKNPSGGATLAAWAWGLHRTLDYLAQDLAIDSQRMALLGHSRRGKAALFAAAMDERVALVVPHQSGTGGMALSRDNDQETIKKINDVFPHWFAESFKQFNDQESLLPVDQHLLVALVAPRLLIDTEGVSDVWANYKSGLRSIQEADKVYRFLGVQGMVASGELTSMPITQANSGRLLQYRLPAEHTLDLAFWNVIIDFADRHWR